LVRLRGRKSKALEDLVNEPLIVELKNGKVYGGLLDSHYYNRGVVVKLYSCELLDKKNHRWVDHDIMWEIDGKLVPHPMPDFLLADIKGIFVLPEEQRDRLYLDDALQIYIDPHYKPRTGITCEWDVGEQWETKRHHSAECDARLHEALVFLITMAHIGVSSGFMNMNRKNEKLGEAQAYIRRRLLMYGARIP